MGRRTVCIVCTWTKSHIALLCKSDFLGQINQTPKCTIIPRTLKHLFDLETLLKNYWKIGVSLIIFNILPFNLCWGYMIDSSSPWVFQVLTICLFLPGNFILPCVFMLLFNIEVQLPEGSITVRSMVRASLSLVSDGLCYHFMIVRQDCWAKSYWLRPFSLKKLNTYSIMCTYIEKSQNASKLLLAS